MYDNTCFEFIDWLIVFPQSWLYHGGQFLLMEEAGVSGGLNILPQSWQASVRSLKINYLNHSDFEATVLNWRNTNISPFDDSDFLDRGLLLTRKLLNQEFQGVKLKSSLRYQLIFNLWVCHPFFNKHHIITGSKFKKIQSLSVPLYFSTYLHNLMNKTWYVSVPNLMPFNNPNGVLESIASSNSMIFKSFTVIHL